MKERLVLLHCSLIEGFGTASLSKVLPYLKSKGVPSLGAIYNLTETDFEQAGLPRDLSKKVRTGLSNFDSLNQELESLDKHNLRVMTILDEEYPKNLKEIHLPPFVLYAKGDLLSNFNKTLAVVGSRKSDAYGTMAINKIVPVAIECGWTIVSGGAYGIDTLAHKKAIELGGKTISILGSGMLNLYPSSNKKLFDQISDQGTLISSFPLHYPPYSGNFPARNRIISGLSKACLVIQAAQKSGALITAQFSLEQGKEVGVIPGPIDSELSQGCHDLIRQGAACITNPVQLLELLNEKITNIKLSEIKDTNLTKTIDQQISALCVTPISFDDLLSKTNLSFIELNTKLMELSLKGVISQDCFGLWHANL